MSSSNQIEMANDVNTMTNSKSLNKKVKQSTKYSKINTDESSTAIEQDDIKVEREKIISDRMDDFSYPIRIEKSKSFCCKRIGNMFALFGDRDGNPLFMIGPHWPMYICFSSVMSAGVILFLFGFWNNLHIVFKILGLIIYSTYMLSYTYTFLINPGYPKNDLDSRTGEPRNKFRWCDKCKMWVNVEKKTNHCFECNICVEGYDHHCP
ncbi:MAG: hypothetical protein MJ252_08795, partial [archaeon]|nr:hypothetical protein [archaeon]